MQSQSVKKNVKGTRLGAIRKVLANSGDSQTSLSAAGCAFFATLSLFPALTASISIYGLVFDLQTVEPQLHVLKNLLPVAAYSLIVERIHVLVMQPHSSLTLGLVFSLLIALWTASAASRAVISALNMAYHTKETRTFLHFQFLAFGTTFLTVLGACLTLALMVAAPALIDYFPRYLSYVGLDARYLPDSLQFLLRRSTPIIVHWLTPAIMLFFVFIAVCLFYRFAPCRAWTRWRWILPGAVVATLLWVLTSLGFSWYVSHFASYGTTYGPLGAVAAVMMWFFVSAYVVIFGAVLNAGIEGYEEERAVMSFSNESSQEEAPSSGP
ncbi:YihY/virulence factor BrkB family protein [Acetobacteraceae bacterium ESL0709]|nr:YihY/virulence factor BrkB family protein [Acetobacteraceae bacterium ESL0697]MDF7677477.1 YihY/virulence factor BrkB family protein [Acetobacteraceae bacterium ESL0709]